MKMRYRVMTEKLLSATFWNRLRITTRLSVLIALIATAISLAFGTVYGLISGLLGGRTDALLMRIVDVLLAFPGMLLALYIAAILRPSTTNLVIALSATSWVTYARLARAKTLEQKSRDHITAAKALGASSARVAFVHLLPSMFGTLIIQASFGVSGAMLAEAALSFLGLGVAPGTPSLGALLDQGVYYLFVAPHVAFYSGLAIAVSVIGFNLLGSGLRDLLDPKSKLV